MPNVSRWIQKTRHSNTDISDRGLDSHDLSKTVKQAKQYIGLNKGRKESNEMEETIVDLIAEALETVAVYNAGSLSVGMAYEPEVPDVLRKEN